MKGPYNRKRIIHITVRDEEDKQLCQYAARINKFKTMAEWMRAIINAHLNMSNLRPLKYIGRRRYQCRHGHKYTKENTIWGTDKTGRKFKLCRKCRNDCYNRSYAKRRLKNGPQLHKVS